VEVIRFKPGAFGDSETDLECWHIWNRCKEYQSEFTLCGMAFEGIGGGACFEDGKAYETKQGKITCPKCIAQIEFCKSIKAKDIKK